MSKTWRLVKIAEPVFQEMGFAVDIPTSQLTSEFRQADSSLQILRLDLMALCHWPCSCYRITRSARPTTDERDLSAVDRSPRHHDRDAGELYHAPTGLKAMIDRPGLRRLGNPIILDPRQTARRSKALELKGWPYRGIWRGGFFG